MVAFQQKKFVFVYVWVALSHHKHEEVCKEISALFVNKEKCAHFCIFAYLPTVCPKLKLMFVLISVQLEILRNVAFFQNVCSVIYFVADCRTWNLHCLTQDKVQVSGSSQSSTCLRYPIHPNNLRGLILGRCIQNLIILYGEKGKSLSE